MAGLDELHDQQTARVDVASPLDPPKPIPTPPLVSGKVHSTLPCNRCNRYATQTLSMPIPVPIPSAHSRLTIAAPCSRPQVMAAQPMAVHPHHALPFGAHAMALKSQFRPAASPRFPGAVVQAPHIRTMGAPPRASRGSYNSPRR